MELQQIWKIFCRWWWLAVTPVVVVAGYVALKYQTPPTFYQIIIRFTAGGMPAGELSADYDRYHAWLSSEYIARGLANISKTGDFAEAVARRLEENHDLQIAPKAVQGAIVPDHAESVLVLYVTWPDPEQLKILDDAISAEITENGPVYFPQMGGIGSVARRVDNLEEDMFALPPSLKAQLMGPALRLMLAAGVGLGLVFLVHYLDPFVRDRGAIEQLGMPIMISIPKRRRRRV